MCREEAWRMTCRLEAPHGPLTLAQRLVGVFCTVIEIAVLAVFHPLENLPLRDATNGHADMQ